jgi:hypothetical protein
MRLLLALGLLVAATPAIAQESDPLSHVSSALDLTLPVEARAEAVGRLGDSTDPRVLPVLEYLLGERESPLRLAAVRAAARIPTPEAQALLLRLVRSPRDMNLRLEAVRGLHAQGLADVPDILESLALDASLPSQVSTLAREELAAHYPDRALPEPEPVVVVRRDRNGQMALSLFGGVFGGYSLMAVGDLGGTDAGVAVGLVGGTLLGAAGGYLVGQGYSTPRSLTLASGAGWGLWTGVGTGLLLLEPSPRRGRWLHLFALGGEVGGGLLTAWWWDALEPHLDRPGAEVDNGIALTGLMLGVPVVHRVSQLRGGQEIGGWAVASGLALGGATGSLVGRMVTDGRGPYLATGTAWSMALGALTLRSLHDDPSFLGYENSVIVGGLLGLGVAQLTWSPTLEGGDVATVNALGGTGAALGLGTVLVREGGDVRAATALVGLATGAGLVAGRLISPYLQFKGGDRSLVGLGLLHGGVAGLLLPDLLWREPERRRVGVGLLGAATGTLVAGASSQFSEYSPSDVGVMLVADGFGAMTGLGASLLSSQELTARGVNTGLLLGSGLTLAAATQLAPHLAFDSGDAALIAVTSTLGAWHGAAFGIGLQTPDTRRAGATLLGLGGGGLSGMALGQVLDYSPGWVAAASSGAVWGIWLSLSSISAFGDLRESHALVILGASDLGLGVTALLLSPLVGVEPVQVGIASLFGAGGAVVFLLGRALVPSQPRDLLVASLVGSGVGLGTGAVVAWLKGPSVKAPPAAARLELGAPERAWASPIRFRGLTSAPVLSADGAVSGGGLALMFEND